MPKSCEPTQVQFNNASTTVIPYTQSLRDKYGIQPKVFTWYVDTVNGGLYMSPFFTVMNFDGNTITVDHGGPNTGIVVVT